jgi:YrbI family 3-deoxy-D-manno-octulosonate 8-phosphate phosphatase
MKFISHRGNINGKILDRENTTSYIQEALDAGYDVEIDVWMIGKEFFLGHDGPGEVVSRDFLQNSRLWVHSKNIQAFLELSKYHKINTFFQDDDLVVITSNGSFWNHSDNTIQHPNTILVSLEWDSNLKYSDSLGVCSDNIRKFREVFKKKPTPSTPFDLLIIDIDGVMTNGTKIYDREGKVLAKQYCDLDFTAIKRFKAAGIKVCFLSGDTTVNQAMAESRKIDFYHARLPSGSIDKAEFLDLLSNKYKVPVSRMAYVGDDYYDLSIIENLNYTFCPSTAATTIKKAVYKILNSPGGHGVIEEIYSLYEHVLPEAFPVDSLEVNPK